MSVKAKLTVVPTVIAAAMVLGVGTTVLENDDPDIVLHADFSTLAGKPTVAVQFSDTVPFVYDVHKTTWDRVIKVAPGLRVNMLVTQHGGSGSANCAILRDGMAKSTNSMLGPGSMGCQYLVR